MESISKIAIIGTVGVPATYGGFETLAENLVSYHDRTNNSSELTVYCSKKNYQVRPKKFKSARLFYINLDANGANSIIYDIISIIDAIRRGQDRILLLGVSGAVLLPLLRISRRPRFVTNIDGIEWKREKWRGLAKLVLRIAEWAAVRFSDTVVADNQAIADYVTQNYGRYCEVIPYGGDHALDSEPDPAGVAGLPDNYALALCRIEPENNVAMILEAFSDLKMPLVFVGNWEKSKYGCDLKELYKDHPTIILHEAIYEPRSLHAIRERASLYVHGHSAGGTNPSLVEMMHFDIPVVAHGCSFNRHTTEEKARYFMNAGELAEAVLTLTPQTTAKIGADMGEIARRRYTWDQIGRSYFELLES